MDFSVITNLIKDLLVALSPFLIGVAYKLIDYFIETLKTKAHKESYALFLDIVDNTVASLYQQTVEELKKNKKLTPELANKIKEKAIGDIKRELELHKNKLFKAILKDVNCNALIGKAIESVIYHKKRGITVGEIETPLSKTKIKGIKFDFKF